jgi:predicted anti-sigma-YlaC factor YlaD
MTHLDEQRWLTIADGELSPVEAEHLGTCSACQGRWERVLHSPALVNLHREEPPDSLLPATLARYDRALHAHARSRSRALLGLCIAGNLCGYAVLRALFSQTGSLPTLLSGVIEQIWTLLGVAARLLSSFPTFAAVSAAALAISALALASFWMRAWRTASEYATQ